jgi:glycosyltransferase involved in cell wall biosynthesis
MSLLVHPVMGDACPNVVVEALACGIPVVAPEFGGTKELIREGGVCFDSEPWNYDESFIIKMKNAVVEAFSRVDELSGLARKQAENELDIKVMTDRYLEVMRLPKEISSITLIRQQPSKTSGIKQNPIIKKGIYSAALLARKGGQIYRKLKPARRNLKPRIAFTLYDFHIGGIESWLFRLASELCQQFDFYFLATKNPSFLAHFSNVGKCVYLSSPLKMTSFLSRERIDIVQVHNERWPVDAALAAGVPRVIERLGGQRSWRRVSKAGIDLVIASSKLAQEAVKDMIDLERIRLIYNGVNLEKIDTAEIRRLFPENTKVIGRSTRFGIGQNLSLLIEAVAKMAQTMTDLRLVMLGSDSLLPGAIPVKNDLVKLAKSKGIDNLVSFPGFLEDPIPYIKGFDIATCVSNDEGIPNSLLEAMACQKPVISTNVGAISELIEDEKNGLLIPAGDLGAFCTQTYRLLENPELCRQLSQAARQTIQDRFNIKNSAALYADVYRELLD